MPSMLLNSVPQFGSSSYSYIDEACVYYHWFQNLSPCNTNLTSSAFHCAIAVSLVALNKLVMKQEGPMEAIHQQSRTLRLVNERLSGKDAVSDTTIAVVVALAQYDRLR